MPPADPHPPAGRSPAAASSSAALAPPRRGPGSAGTSEMGPCYGYGKMGKTWEKWGKIWMRHGKIWEKHGKNDEKLGLKEKPSESTKLLTPLNFGRKEENLVRFGWFWLLCDSGYSTMVVASLTLDKLASTSGSTSAFPGSPVLAKRLAREPDVQERSLWFNHSWVSKLSWNSKAKDFGDDFSQLQLDYIII